MEINIEKKVKVQAKTLKIHCKVRNCFDAVLCDQDGDELKNYEGYVPSFMPGQHFGDYLILDVDLDTGQITNWKKPSTAEIEAFIRGEEE